MMTWRLFLEFTVLALQPAIDADTLLNRSMAYHDSQGRFLSQAHRFIFEDERPEGEPRGSEVMIDVAREHFQMIRRGDDEIGGTVSPDSCHMTLNGKTEVSDEQREKYRLSCERIRLFRNYYTFLWGLPMKLKDPGTHLGTPFADHFNGRDAMAIRVHYDQDVGKDIWYIYFDKKTYAMIGYRFYHDEQKGDGEYILLEGETAGNGMRLPKTRKWYTHQGDRWLGTDHLLEIKAVHAQP